MDEVEGYCGEHEGGLVTVLKILSSKKAYSNIMDNIIEMLQRGWIETN